ncbi:MAG: glycosyltransferase family 4 protein [Patescibacteria group bacterium]
MNLDHAKKYILFVHRLSERKGADLIAKTAARLASLENIEFVVAGDGPYREKLKEEAMISTVPVKMLGKIPNAKIPNYFRAADIFFMPSREEGSPHVILEAMAAGTPFVAADVGGVREIIPKEAEEFLCPAENIEAFSEKIKELLGDSQRYAAFRETGLRHAKNFSLERGVKEFIALFE